MNEKVDASQIRLRPMALADLDQVEAIDRASFPTPWPKHAFLYELKHQRNSVSWVAEWVPKDGRPALIVATIVVWLVVDEAHIGTLAVRPGFRTQGIAQYLLAEALLKCSQRGAIMAHLEVRETNTAAQQLYFKFGFKPVGIRQGYYKDTHENAILMTLEPIDVAKLAELAEFDE